MLALCVCCVQLRMLFAPLSLLYSDVWLQTASSCVFPWHQHTEAPEAPDHCWVVTTSPKLDVVEVHQTILANDGNAAGPCVGALCTQFASPARCSSKCFCARCTMQFLGHETHSRNIKKHSWIIGQWCHGIPSVQWFEASCGDISFKDSTRLWNSTRFFPLTHRGNVSFGEDESQVSGYWRRRSSHLTRRLAGLGKRRFWRNTIFISPSAGHIAMSKFRHLLPKVVAHLNPGTKNCVLFHSFNILYIFVTCHPCLKPELDFSNDWDSGYCSRKAFPAGTVMSVVAITTARSGWRPIKLHLRFHDTCATLLFHALGGFRTFPTWDCVSLVLASSGWIWNITSCSYRADMWNIYIYVLYSLQEVYTPVCGLNILDT